MDSLLSGVQGFSEVVKDFLNPFNLETGIFDIFKLYSLFQILLVTLRKNEIPFIKPKQTFNETYDYIIVGAGTAGSVLANRLSEIHCLSVLLLEAGGEQPIFTEVPSYARAFFGSPIDWHYLTVPQVNAALGQKENRVVVNNGKVLGGSSVMNAMEAVRGNKENYDQWAEEGATGWSYDDVFPYFLKLEDNRNIDKLDKAYHSTGGPMTWEAVNYAAEIKEPIIEAVKDIGYDLVDSNAETQTGLFDFQMTARNQQRCSTAKAYLHPARKRPNLDVLTYAYARKILIRRRTKRAYGVEFDHGGKTHRVRARREVILASGAIKTPQLLMLSGIGPRKHLEKLNIKVIADLPVGKNLMDHVTSFLVYTVKKTIMNVILKNLNPINILNYVTHRKGPLCSPTQTALIGFFNGVNNTKDPVDFPNEQLFFVEYDVLDILLNLNVKNEVFHKVFARYKGRPLFACFSTLLQPYGRGDITLNSTDPYEKPLIDPKYHQDERDLKVVVEGLKLCNAVAKHPAMKKVKAKPLETVLPGCKDYVGNEDEYLTCYARHIVTTFWHFSGTARMGQRNDSRSVIDPELRVIGIDNLRVVSGASLPIIPSGNTNIPIMMVAEKASDLIKQDIDCKE